MMLYLRILTMGFADYGLAVIRHRTDRLALRRMRYQLVMAAVFASGVWCGIFGYRVGDPLMVLLAVIGVVSMIMQQVFVFREYVPGLGVPPPKAYVGERFRALIGMGIAALDTLPERTKVLFLAYRVDGQSQKDIAASEGISLSAVEKHLQRAYRLVAQIRKKLDAGLGA